MSAMTLERLRVFVAVVRHGTFAAAADALSYTPSAVSQQMARLESEAGTLLVERRPGGVVLTEAGRRLFARADEILGLVEDTRNELEAVKRDEACRLAFGSFPTATQALVVRALQVLSIRRPEIAVRLVDDEPHGLLTRIEDRTLDLAIVFRLPGRPIGRDYRGRIVADDDAIAYLKLFDDPFVLVVPDDHALSHVDVVDADALDFETIIGSADAPGLDVLRTTCRERGVEPVFSGDAIVDYFTVRSFVAAGAGVAVVPRLACAVPYPGTTTVPLGGVAPVREVLLASSARRPAPASAAAMTDVLRALTGERQLAALAA